MRMAPNLPRQQPVIWSACISKWILRITTSYRHNAPKLSKTRWAAMLSFGAMIGRVCKDNGNGKMKETNTSFARMSSMSDCNTKSSTETANRCLFSQRTCHGDSSDYRRTSTPMQHQWLRRQHRHCGWDALSVVLYDWSKSDDEWMESYLSRLRCLSSWSHKPQPISEVSDPGDLVSRIRLGCDM